MVIYVVKAKKKKFRILSFLLIFFVSFSIVTDIQSKKAKANPLLLAIGGSGAFTVGGAATAATLANVALAGAVVGGVALAGVGGAYVWNKYEVDAKLGSWYTSLTDEGKQIFNDLSVSTSNTINLTYDQMKKLDFGLLMDRVLSGGTTTSSKPLEETNFDSTVYNDISTYTGNVAQFESNIRSIASTKALDVVASYSTQKVIRRNDTGWILSGIESVPGVEISHGAMTTYYFRFKNQTSDIAFNIYEVFIGGSILYTIKTYTGEFDEFRYDFSPSILLGNANTTGFISDAESLLANVGLTMQDLIGLTNLTGTGSICVDAPKVNSTDKAVPVGNSVSVPRAQVREDGSITTNTGEVVSTGDASFPIGTSTSGTWTSLWDWLAKILSALNVLNWLEKLWQLLSDFITWLTTWLGALVTSLVDAFDNRFRPPELDGPNIPNLFSLIGLILLALIQVMLAAILMIIRLRNIPPDTSLLDPNVLLGLDFLKGQEVLPGVTYMNAILGVAMVIQVAAMIKLLRKYIHKEFGGD